MMTQTDVLIWIQQFSAGWLDMLMIGLSFIGDEEFYLAMVPLIYFGVHKQIGVRLGVVLAFSLFANEWAKVFFATDRPIGADGVRSLYTDSAPGYAFPSGHAQGTATFWAYLAWQVKKTWFGIFAALMVLGVMLSRLYLGVHWPVDVVGGLVLGLLFVALFVWTEKLLQRHPLSFSMMMALGLALPLLLLLFFNDEDARKLSGFLMGFWAGYLVETRTLGMQLSHRLGQRLLVVLIGIVTVFLLRAGLKAVLPAMPVTDFVRYAGLGLWGALGAPWLFVRLGLYPSKRR